LPASWRSEKARRRFLALILIGVVGLKFVEG